MPRAQVRQALNAITASKGLILALIVGSLAEDALQSAGLSLNSLSGPARASLAALAAVYQLPWSPAQCSCSPEASLAAFAERQQACEQAQASAVQAAA